MQFYTILTVLGASKIANAVALQQAINLKSIAIGDGNGSYPTISETDTTLVNEVYRSDIIDFSTGGDGYTQVTVESYVPSNIGDFYVREVGVYDTDGDLVAIGIYPETYKPILTSGAAKDLKLRLVLEVGNVDSVTVQIDPNIIVASRTWVNNKFLFEKPIVKIITEDYIASRNEDLYVDTTLGAINITLPGPKNNLKIWITDLKSNLEVNKLIVSRNGATIMGIAEDMDVQKNNISFLIHCVEIAENTFDWRIK